MSSSRFPGPKGHGVGSIRRLPLVPTSISDNPSRKAKRPSRSVFGLSFDEFESLQAKALRRSIQYQDLFRRSPSPAVERWAKEHGLAVRSLREIAHERGRRAHKILFGLEDGYAVESVLIRRHDGATACLSSQVGCAYSCRFCASGQAGLKRHLTAGEIVEQVVRWGPQVNRIVFMGIGEPLHNYDEVLRAIRILRDRRGLRFPTSGITISTIGIPKALVRLREEHLAIQLTVSLHATTQELRSQLIPGSRNHDIREVVERALSWADRHRRVVTFVYLVLPGINDGPGDVARLVDWFAGRRARVNLMRWNPVEGVALPATSDLSLWRFKTALQRAGIPVAVRDTQGRDIAAACGQLWLREGAGEVVGKAPGQRRRGGVGSKRGPFS